MISFTAKKKKDRVVRQRHDQFCLYSTTNRWYYWLYCCWKRLWLAAQDVNWRQITGCSTAESPLEVELCQSLWARTSCCRDDDKCVYTHQQDRKKVEMETSTVMFLKIGCALKKLLRIKLMIEFPGWMTETHICQFWERLLLPCLRADKNIEKCAVIGQWKAGMMGMCHMSRLQIRHSVCAEVGPQRPLCVHLCTLALGDVKGWCRCLQCASGNSLGSMSNIRISKWAKKTSLPVTKALACILCLRCCVHGNRLHSGTYSAEAKNICVEIWISLIHLAARESLFCSRQAIIC